jgi:4-hydroxybenzoate polyprenyltransferase
MQASAESGQLPLGLPEPDAQPAGQPQPGPPPPEPQPQAPARWPARGRQLFDILQLMRLDKPIGTLLLLWPMLWALWFAGSGTPARALLAIFLIGALAMRSAGCVVNDLLDRNIDPHVARTRNRPLAARRLSPYTALVVLLVLLVLALCLALQLNAATLRLAFIGAALSLSYPLLKRFFSLPQIYLGFAFGWAVPMAFSATLGFVPREGWVLFIATVLWACIYDTFYAMVDRDDDRRIGVRSSAISFGEQDLLVITAMQAMMLLALFLVGRSLHRGSRFHWALLAGALLFAWQLWTARRRDRAGCFRAFRQNNWYGLVVFAGIVADYAAHPAQ